MLGMDEREGDHLARQLAILLAVVGIASVIYLSAISGSSGLGFPLDDAWIHQTYARNLAGRGEWSFIPGEASAGSTAPLWTILLAIAYRIGVSPLIWAYVLGIILLAFTAWFSGRWFLIRNPEMGKWAPFVAALVGLEWHLIWAAVSGMETIATALVVVLLFWLLDRHEERWVGLGALIGLGVWVRPDAITLLFPLGLMILLGKQDTLGRVARRGAGVIFGTALLFVPYLYFNRINAGEILPNTFYAKQGEYALLQQLPLSERLISVLGSPFIGPASVLLPGVFLFVVHHIRHRDWSRLVPLAWALAYLGMYALRLPVTYQHGRYAMPTIPVLLVIGLEGMGIWIRPGAARLWRRLLSRAWVGAVGGLTLGFIVLGARAFRQDVAIIQTEMVATAKWIQRNTPPGAVIAAHDIGAMGYFSQRELIDLAGLVSPEVIPFMRDEAALKHYLDEHGADYLVTFPGWYPELSQYGEVVFRTNAEPSPAAGGENMVVYAWP
jgi:hypothetical protein